MNKHLQTKTGHSEKTLSFNPVSMIASGVLIFLALFYAIYLWNTHEYAEHAKSQFHKNSVKHVGAIRTSLIMHVKVVNTLGAFFNHASEITREEFHIFAGSLSQTSPGMQALEWIPKVTAAQRREYEEEAGKTFSGFRFTQLDENGSLIKASPREVYYPVYFVEPYAGNKVALGFDLASETLRLDTMNQARDSAKIAMSELLTLVQERENQQALLTFLPIYQQGAKPVDTAQRRQLLKGFVLAVSHIGGMFERAIKQLDIPGIDVWVYGASDGAQKQLLHSHTSEPSGTPTHQPPAQGLRQEQTINTGGYQWRIITAPSLTAFPLYQSRSSIAWELLLIGVFVTGIVFWHLIYMRKYAFNLLQSNSSLDKAIEQLRSHDMFLKKSKVKLESALREADLERSRLIDAIESIDASIAIYDADERLIVCNKKYRETYHQVAHMILPGALYKDMLEEYFRVTKIGLVTGKTIDEWVNETLTNHRRRIRGQIQQLHDQWIRISDYPTSEGGVVSLRSDITSEKIAEGKIHSLNRTRMLLSKCSISLARSIDENALVNDFSRHVHEVGGYSFCWVAYSHQDNNNRVHLIANNGEHVAQSAAAFLSCTDPACATPCPSQVAVDTGETLVIRNMGNKSYCNGWIDLAMRKSHLSVIALPLKFDEEILGSFSIFSTNQEAFQSEEVSLLEELAEIFSLAIGTMRKRAAREQKMLLFKNEVEQDERKRIAATLHDGVAQTMQAVNLNLKGLSQQISNEPQTVVDSLNQIILNTGDVINNLRDISHDLRPIFLERMGFEEAVRHHCNEVSLHSKIIFHIASNIQNLDLGDIQKEQCFLSFRESMNNAIRHAEATRIDITMETLDSDLLSIQIRDNGVGFNTDHTFHLPSGLGLSMISERIQSIGGHAEIKSSPGAGTIVTLVVPVKS